MHQRILSRLVRGSPRDGHVLTALISLALIFSSQVSAEIYRWVDSKGNVHYGDKPLDARTAAKAKTVELKPSYTPAQRSADEAAAVTQAKNALDQRNAARRKAEGKEKEERLAALREQKAAQCAQDRALLRKVDDTKENKDSRIFYYMNDENGKPLTVAKQKQAVLDLKQKIAKNC